MSSPWLKGRDAAKRMQVFFSLIAPNMSPLLRYEGGRGSYDALLNSYGKSSLIIKDRTKYRSFTMKRSVMVKVFMLLILLTATMAFMSAGVASAADAISFPASEPQTIYYTTNGATPTTPVSNISAASTVSAIATFSLVPNAGKGTSYKKPEKLKIHESKQEFEKHVKQKHGNRFKVATFNVKQKEHGLEGFIDIIENKDPTILQLGERCTEEERAFRIAIAKEVMLNNPEMIGLTENDELRERSITRDYCNHFYFDRYINEFEAPGVYHLIFQPQYNYSIYAELDPITPEMYAAAQQKGLSEEEIADIVYKDLNIPTTDNNGKRLKKLPKLEMRKYLRNKVPYAYWRVAYKNVYEIDAITGEIAFKQPNIRY